MSRSIPSHRDSAHYRDYICRIFNLPLADVVDLTGYINCGGFIAAGGSGQIYKGQWMEPNNPSSHGQHALPKVAVKLISVPALISEKRKEKRFKSIRRELEVWSGIKHRNILPLVGIARIGGDANRLAFVSPWMEFGNVMDFIKQHPTFPAVSFLRDIMKGLYYLHTFEPEVVHGDIKAANVLVNCRKEAYLCDFGLSRFVVDNTLWRTTAAQANGTLRWMAPELLEGEEITPTKASDIYAYAMTCYEILSGKVPFESCPNDATAMLKVLRGQRPERIVSCHTDELWLIITQCWEQSAKNRPSTEEVLKAIRHMTRLDESKSSTVKEDNVLSANDPRRGWTRHDHPQADGSAVVSNPLRTSQRTGHRPRFSDADYESSTDQDLFGRRPISKVRIALNPRVHLSHRNQEVQYHSGEGTSHPYPWVGENTFGGIVLRADNRDRYSSRFGTINQARHPISSGTEAPEQTPLAGIAKILADISEQDTDDENDGYAASEEGDGNVGTTIEQPNDEDQNGDMLSPGKAMSWEPQARSTIEAMRDDGIAC